MTSPRAPLPRPIDDEQKFLQHQKAELRLALGGALHSLWHDTRTAATPDRWVRQFPLASVGVAATAGYIAARRLKRPAAPVVPAEPARAPHDGASAGTPKPPRHRWLS